MAPSKLNNTAFLKKVVGNDGIPRYYTTDFLKRIDFRHYQPLLEMIILALDNEYTYADNGLVLGDHTRLDCRKLKHHIFQPHGDMTQLVFVRQPKGVKEECMNTIVGKAKGAVDCRKNKRKGKAGKSTGCDCPEGEHFTKVIANMKGRGNKHPTMRLNQIVAPILAEHRLWLFLATRVKLSGGAPTYLCGDGEFGNEVAECATPPPHACPPSPSCSFSSSTMPPSPSPASSPSLPPSSPSSSTMTHCPTLNSTPMGSPQKYDPMDTGYGYPTRPAFVKQEEGPAYPICSNAATMEGPTACPGLALGGDPKYFAMAVKEEEQKVAPQHLVSSVLLGSEIPEEALGMEEDNTMLYDNYINLEEMEFESGF